MRGRSRSRPTAPAQPVQKSLAKRAPLFGALDHGVVQATLLGRPLRFGTARGLFSADRVDDGTRLLLANLPATAERPPREVLDLGCGYGALGLPIAATLADTRVTLVDRDLVAVAYAARNAETLGLANAHGEGGLGYRDLDAAARFDWVLCNVPARIGDRGIAYLIDEGARRLTPDGELRVVVIRDLATAVAQAATETGLAIREVARGSRHLVFACGPRSTPQPGTSPATRETHELLYARDEISLDGRTLMRPHDLGEDAAHLRDALPLLLGVLPRQGGGLRALVLRGGYGAVALALAGRGATVIAADRDLLATTFTRRNAEHHGLVVSLRERAWLPDAAEAGERFDLVVAEASDAAGAEATRRELTSVRKLLAPNGHALWLLRKKHVAELIAPLAEHGRPPIVLAERGAYAVLRDAP